MGYFEPSDSELIHRGLHEKRNGNWLFYDVRLRRMSMPDKVEPNKLREKSIMITGYKITLVPDCHGLKFALRRDVRSIKYGDDAISCSVDNVANKIQCVFLMFCAKN